MSSTAAPFGCPAHGEPSPELEPRPAPRSAPGPRGLPVIGVAASLARDPYGFLPRMAREYGDVVRIALPGFELVLVSHPEHVNHLLNRHTKRYRHMPAAVTDALIPGGPPGLPIREGSDWKRVRRLLTPTFSERSLAALSPLIAAPIYDAVDGWTRYVDSGEEVELQPELAHVVMAALTNSLFSGSLDRAGIDRWVRQSAAHGEFFARALLTFAILDAAPMGIGRLVSRKHIPFLRAGWANYSSMTAVIDELIAERLREPNDAPDMLNLILGADFDDGTQLTREEVRSELLTLMFAGFETTAAVLAWAIALLTQHPDVLDEARREIDALGDTAIGYEHLDQLPFLRACFDEAQRVQSAPLNLRVALEDDEIGGFRIPEGTFVAVSLFGMHHDPRFWNEPDVFRPRRFLEDEINKYAFLPFGVGPRRCLGMRMAYIEGLIALASILQRYEFTLPDGWEPVRKFHLSTGLASLPVRIHERRS